MILRAPTAIVLDESPLSLLTQRRGHPLGDACRAWYAALTRAGCRFYVPEIADYELRRELLRTARADAVIRLDAFNEAATDRYRPLTTADVREAARLWAQARSSGQPGAPPDALDGDVLIAAQARHLIPADYGLAGAVVATANPRHLEHLTDAALWSDLQFVPPDEDAEE